MGYPLEDRQEFALLAHASVCFQNCVCACDLIVEQKLTPSDTLYKPLSVWAVIEYAKPFKRSRGIGSLRVLQIPESHKKCHEFASVLQIPEAYKKCHEFAIGLRDKIVAHMDTQTSDGGQPHLHDVRIEVAPRKVNYLVGEPKIPPDHLTELKALASKLAKKAGYRATRHVKKMYIGIKQEGLGEFLVDLEEPNGGLVKLTKSEKAWFWD